MARPIKAAPALKLHKNGKYYIHWYDPTTRRTKSRSTGTGDKVLAQQTLAHFMMAGESPLKAVVAPSVTDCTNYYLENHINREAVDPVRTRNCLIAINRYFGTTIMAEVDHAKCRAYCDWRVAQGIAMNTAGRELSALKAAANFALLNKVIGKDEFPTIKLPSRDRTPHKVKSFTKAQVRALIEVAEANELGQGLMARYFRILYYTGARRNTIEDLHVSQIDFAKNRINLHREGRRRTKKRNPVVPLFDQIKDDIVYLVGEAGRDGYLFPRHCEKMNHFWFRQFHRALALAGIEGEMTLHMIRHSRATHLLEDGANINRVAALLGDNISTVETHYAHVKAEDEDLMFSSL